MITARHFSWLHPWMGWTGVIAVLFILGAIPALAETLLRDDFTRAQGRYEFIGGRAWKIGGGACRFAAPGRETFAVANLDELNDARIEATVTIAKRVSPSYITAGLTFFLDAENHWRLILVASPEDRPYFELIERHQGVHQAQSAAPPAATRLASKKEGDLDAWKYGQSYRLVLTIGPKAITGEVRDPASSRFWRTTYSFVTGRAVRSGRPGLCAGGTEGAFQDLLVEGVRPSTAPALSPARGEAGSVAILRDEGNKLAPALQELFSRAGFGVTVLEWDDLNRGRLPAESLDLFVLADARRVPASVGKKVVSFLRSRGKVIAIGAPAFGEVLVKTPKGYVTQERYGESVYNSLAKREIPLSADGWKRSCMKHERAAKIEPEAQDRAWKVTSDLEGWDTFGQPVENAFAGGHTLLCFRARGDASTSQLSIECTERDGRVGRPVSRRADVCRIPVRQPGNSQQCIQVAGLALVDGHAGRRVALQMLDIPETLGYRQLDIFDSDVVLQVQPLPVGAPGRRPVHDANLTTDTGFFDGG